MTNYGSDSALRVGTTLAGNARALIRFTLPPIPAGCHLTVARLRLSASSFKRGRILQAFRLAGRWTESEITWSTKPPTIGAAANTAPRSGSVEWIVTTHVRNMYAAANYGFLVRDQKEDGVGIEQVFSSREVGASNSPRLIVSFGIASRLSTATKDRASSMAYRTHVLGKKSSPAPRRAGRSR